MTDGLATIQAVHASVVLSFANAAASYSSHPILLSGFAVLGLPCLDWNFRPVACPGGVLKARVTGRQAVSRHFPRGQECKDS
jgi:hypothetical protein